MFQLDQKSRRSIYEQVIDNIKELIVTGVLPAGTRLPSVRELSKTITVNPNTVQKAYRELEREGFIDTVTGLGTFVSSRERPPADERRIAGIRDGFRSLVRELRYLGVPDDTILAVFQDVLAERSEHA